MQRFLTFTVLAAIYTAVQARAPFLHDSGFQCDAETHKKYCPKKSYCQQFEVGGEPVCNVESYPDGCKGDCIGSGCDWGERCQYKAGNPCPKCGRVCVAECKRQLASLAEFVDNMP
ncbi:unnamed protein product, partial [Mesorhabditis spiculigera]